MVNFKKGDRVIVSGKYDFYSNGLGVIEDVGLSRYGVRLYNGRYVAAEFKNVKHYKEDSVKVKVGDTVVSVSDEDIDIAIGKKYVVTAAEGFMIQFRDDNNYLRTRDIRDYRVIKTSTPPQKITQNGYEYSLAGPVKPEWLVDGAWVVNVHDGGKRLIEEVSPGVFNLKVNDLVSIRYHEGIRDQYRTHTASDWKWGDWAIYEGKRVFVMAGVNNYRKIAITFPGIDPKCMEEFPRNYKFVSSDGLTPTF